MLIDFHTHVFPDKIAEKTIKYLEERSDGKAYSDGTVLGLYKQMEKSGADIAVSLPVVTKPSQFDGITEFARKINENFYIKGKGILSFGGIHPRSDDIKGKMKTLKDLGFSGVKIHPDYQDTFIDDDGYIEILKAAKDLDMIVVTHAGIDDGYKGEPVKCPPELVLKVIRKVGHEKFVLGHYGGHKLWEEVYDKLAGENVYFDTAFTFHEIDKDLFIKILDKHGADRVLFATDCPWRDINEDKNIFLSYGLSDDVNQSILFKNAEKLLNIRVKKWKLMKKRMLWAVNVP